MLVTNENTIRINSRLVNHFSSATVVSTDNSIAANLTNLLRPLKP